MQNKALKRISIRRIFSPLYSRELIAPWRGCAVVFKRDETFRILQIRLKGILQLNNNRAVLSGWNKRSGEGGGLLGGYLYKDRIFLVLVFCFALNLKKSRGWKWCVGNSTWRRNTKDFFCFSSIYPWVEIYEYLCDSARISDTQVSNFGDSKPHPTLPQPLNFFLSFFSISKIVN